MGWTSWVDMGRLSYGSRGFIWYGYLRFSRFDLGRLSTVLIVLFGCDLYGLTGDRSAWVHSAIISMISSGMTAG